MPNDTEDSVKGSVVGTSEPGGTRTGVVQATTGVHPVVFGIGLGATIWFLVVSWLYFAWDGHVDLDLAVMSAYFTIFFAVFLVMAIGIIKDPRWLQRRVSFREFLRSKVPTSTGEMSGWDVLIGITLIPVSLSFAASIIGLAWTYLH